MPEKSQPFACRGFALPGQAGAEDEGNFGNLELGLADGYLEQNLEANRVELVEVQSAQTHREEPRHRVRQPGQSQRKDRLRQGGGQAGYGAPVTTSESSGVPAILVAGSGYQIQLSGLADSDQPCRQLGRMLQVPVHYDGP